MDVVVDCVVEFEVVEKMDVVLAACGSVFMQLGVIKKKRMSSLHVFNPHFVFVWLD